MVPIENRPVSVAIGVSKEMDNKKMATQERLHKGTISVLCYCYSSAYTTCLYCGHPLSRSTSIIQPCRLISPEVAIIIACVSVI